MGKGNSGLLTKHQSKHTYTATGIIGDATGFEVLTEVVVRLKTVGATASHVVRLSARMANDSSWEDIGTIEGSVSKAFHIASWDFVRFESLVFSANASEVTLITSGFFNDGMFVTDAVNAMSNKLVDAINELSSTLCDIKSEIKVINRQIELITDHEEDEVK